MEHDAFLEVYCAQCLWKLRANLPDDERHPDGLSRAGRSLVREKQRRRAMRSLSNILVPVDLESVVLAPLEYAGWLVAGYQARADLIYVSPWVAARDSNARDPWRDAMLELMVCVMEWCQSGCHSFDPEATPLIVGHIAPGEPAQTILEFAAASRHDFILMSSRRKEAHGPRGEVVRTVVAEAVAPVLIFPEQPRLAQPHPKVGQVANDQLQ
jgi:nucleotide-binding universal stress UspA family protein